MTLQENRGHTDHELTHARSAAAPLFSLLRSQPGGSEVSVLDDEGRPVFVMVIARLRRLRQALYPPSAELRALMEGDRSAANNAERRRLRAIEYPEPVRAVVAA